MLQQLQFREDQSKPHQDCLALGVATEITLRDVGVQRSEWDATVSRYPRCVASFANGAKHLASQYRLSTRCLPSNGWCRDPAGRVGLINRRTPESYIVPQPLGTCGWSHADQPVRKSIPAIRLWARDAPRQDVERHSASPLFQGCEL